MGMAGTKNGLINQFINNLKRLFVNGFLATGLLYLRNVAFGVRIASVSERINVVYTRSLSLAHFDTICKVYNTAIWRAQSACLR